MTSPPTTETLAARLTARMPAAIATVAIRGPRAIEIVTHLVRISHQHIAMGRVYYGQWQLSGTATSEQVVVCRTHEDQVEVHCHGGAAICAAILSDVEQAGCRIVSPALWPSELNCPIARAAEQDLLLSTTDLAAAILLDQMQGALRRELNVITSALAAGESLVAEEHIEALLAQSDYGLHLADPWRVVLAGPTNVGKSSLMNALVGTKQAIVHHEPGTTRDWIEATGAIDGLSIQFTDTAGVRDGLDAIERAGVERSRERLRVCDLAILVVDAGLGWTETHAQLEQLAPSRKLVVWNKVDLLDAGEVTDSSDCAQPPRHLSIIPTSVVTHGGIDQLLATISQQLVPTPPSPGAAVPFRRDQVQRLGEALRLLRSGERSVAIEYWDAWLAELALDYS